jgi:hypothetical protein
MLQFAEGEVTKLRREFKLVLAEPEAAALCARLSQSLEGSLAPPTTRITSVYFDHPGWPLALRAMHTPDDCFKVRTKEYAPDLGAEGVQRVVLEVKRELGGVTRKHRVWVPRAQLREALHGGVDLPLIAEGHLLPALAVTYRRHVYQGSRTWRVTVDREIGYHRITPELALGEAALSAERLGPPRFQDERVVVEVKHLGEELPEWLADLHPGRGLAYSKFAEGMTRIHGFLAARSVGG